MRDTTEINFVKLGSEKCDVAQTPKKRANFFDTVFLYMALKRSVSHSERF